MSYELANEKWLKGKASGLLGQIASTRGLADLVAAVGKTGYHDLRTFLHDGVSADVEAVRKDLGALIDANDDADVQSVARDIRRLAAGQSIIVITNGSRP